MNTPKAFLILAALEQEKQALMAKLESEEREYDVETSSLNPGLGLTVSRVKFSERSIRIIKTGIGPVNAGLALALANEREPVDAVILLGVGGALRDDLNVGDLVVSTRVLQHDYFYSFDHGDVRIRPGALILSSDEACGHAAEISADPSLVHWVKNAEIRPGSRGRVLEGAVLSGSEFVGRLDRKRAISALLPDAMLVDMEAAGVAQVADRLGIPFVVAKTVADRLNPDGTIESDFRKCLDAACDHAAAALHSLLMSDGRQPLR